MKIYQVYYKAEQLKQLDSTSIPFHNQNCNVFFENEVIRSIVSRLPDEPEYVGILSHNFRQKLGNIGWGALNNHIGEFDWNKFRDKLLAEDPDVMGLGTFKPHDPIAYAGYMHPNFQKYWEHIMAKIGFAWEPVVLTNIFYCNYFVATEEVYKKYVNDMLVPAMGVMNEMPELMQNANYNKTLPEHLKKSFGIDHYPYHPFICERLFMFYAHYRKLKCSFYD